MILSAKTANQARKEAAKLWPNNDVKLVGYRDGDCVYITLVRNVTRGPVATATKGIPANVFEATPVN